MKRNNCRFKRMKPVLAAMATALIASGCAWNTYQYLAAGVDARCFDVKEIARENFTRLADKGIAPYPRGSRKQVARKGTTMCTTTNEEMTCVTKSYPMPTEGECLAQMASMRQNAPILFETWRESLTAFFSILSIPFIAETLNIAQ